MAGGLATGRLLAEPGQPAGRRVDREGRDRALIGALYLADGMEAPPRCIDRQPARVIDAAGHQERLEPARRVVKTEGGNAAAVGIAIVGSRAGQASRKRKDRHGA